MSPLQGAKGIGMAPPRAGEAPGASVHGMLLNARTTACAGLAACLGLGAALVGAGPVGGQSPPQQVTSDTPEYCLRLLDQVSEVVRVASVPPPQTVRSLAC